MRACRMGDVAGTGRATPSRAGASARSSTWAGRMRRGMCVGCRGRRGRRTGCRASRSGSTWRVRGRPGRIILVRACRRRRRTTGGSERCGSGRELSGECVRAARRARERMGVGGGLLERQLQRGAIERECVDSRGIVAGGCCAAAPGSAIPGPSSRPRASGAPPATGTATSGFALPVRSHLDSLRLYLGGPGGAEPPGRFFRGFSPRLSRRQDRDEDEPAAVPERGSPAHRAFR